MPRSEFLRSDDLPISSTGASTTIVGASGGGTVGTDAQTLQGHPAADFLSPSYVTVTNDGNLTAERALAVGSGLAMTDGGANGTVTLDLADGVAGAGLTISGKVLSVGAGLGITVNTDDVALSSSVAGAGLTYNAGVLNVGAGAGITVNADDVALTTPGTLTSSTLNSSAGNHTHAVTAYSDGSVYPGHLLKSDASGDLKLHKLELSDRLRASLLDSQAGTSLTIQPALDLLLSPGSGLAKATSGVALQSDGYASQTTGWRITYDGQGDFRYLYSNELHAKAFIADLEQALAGEQIICKSVAVLAANFVLPTAGNSADFYVEDLPGVPDQAVFQSGDMVRFRQYSRSAGSLTIGDAWGTVSNYADQANGIQKWTFTRSAAPNAGSASGTINAKTLVLDYGTAGNGFYEVNAIDGLWAANSPYAQIATWTTHPAADTVTRARFGNLNGLFGVANEYGLYAGDGTATTNKYLRLSNQFLEGHNLPIHLYDGSTQVIKLEPGTNPYIAVGNPAPSGYLSASGIWAGRDSDTLYKMHVGTISGGDIAKGWKWDGSNLVVKGDVYITNGDIAGTPASYVHGWQYSNTTYINGGAIQANTVTAQQMTVTNANMVDNWSFEYGGLGWTLNTGAAVYSGGGHTGNYRLAGDGGRASGYIYAFQVIPVQAGAVYYGEIWCYVSSNSRPTGMTIAWLDRAGADISYSDCYGLTTSGWTKWSVLAAAPSNAASARLQLCQWGDPATYPGAGPRWDDVVFRPASGMNLLVGTPGSSRVEINNNGIEGYDSSNTKQFYIRTSDGRGAFGPAAKPCILDSTGIMLYGNETTPQDWTAIRWLTSPPTGTQIARVDAGLFYTSGTPELYLTTNPSYSYSYANTVLQAYGPASDRYATVTANAYASTNVSASRYLHYGSYEALEQLSLDSAGNATWTAYATGTITGGLNVGSATGAGTGDGLFSGKVGVNTAPVNARLQVEHWNGSYDSNSVAFLTGENTAGGYNLYNIRHTWNASYGVASDDADMWLNYRGYQAGTSYYRDLRIGNGKGTAVVFVDGSTGRVGIGVTSAVSYQLQLSTDSAAKPSTNTWTIASDIRLKRDIVPFTDGLEVLRRVNPIRYTYNGLAGMPESEGIGVIGQEIEKVAPYTARRFKARLKPDDAEETELVGFNSHALTFVLINAVKELDSRLSAIERGRN